MRSIEELETYLTGLTTLKGYSPAMQKGVDEIFWLAKYYRSGEKQNAFVIKHLRGSK